MLVDGMLFVKTKQIAERAFCTHPSVGLFDHLNARTDITPGAGPFTLALLGFEHRFEDYDRQVKHKHGNILHATTTLGALGPFPE